MGCEGGVTWGVMVGSRGHVEVIVHRNVVTPIPRAVALCPRRDSKARLSAAVGRQETSSHQGSGPG
jgi:hypothetical protein